MADDVAEGRPSRPWRLVTLKRRSEFLSVRKGARWASAMFVLEARRRAAEEGAAAVQARFGFTVTKQIGGAVERNRIRRRLKAAVMDAGRGHARPDFDYVVIARKPALGCPFAALVTGLVTALERVHATPRQGRGERKAHK
jgi:ribonuclease P protein component